MRRSTGISPPILLLLLSGAPAPAPGCTPPLFYRSCSSEGWLSLSLYAPCSFRLFPTAPVSFSGIVESVERIGATSVLLEIHLISDNQLGNSAALYRIQCSTPYVLRKRETWTSVRHNSACMHSPANNRSAVWASIPYVTYHRLKSVAGAYDCPYYFFGRPNSP
jgi:hypothetical protein